MADELVRHVCAFFHQESVRVSKSVENCRFIRSRKKRQCTRYLKLPTHWRFLILLVLYFFVWIIRTITVMTCSTVISFSGEKPLPVPFMRPSCVMAATGDSAQKEIFLQSE